MNNNNYMHRLTELMNKDWITWTREEVKEHERILKDTGMQIGIEVKTGKQIIY